MVGRDPALFFLAPLEQRKINHPEEVPFPLGDELQFAKLLGATLLGDGFEFRRQGGRFGRRRLRFEDITMASNERRSARLRRQKRVRKSVVGTDARPRVCVFRSNKHIYAQVISDDRGATLAAASTLSAKSAAQDESKKNHGVEAAKRVGLQGTEHHACGFRPQRVSLPRPGEGGGGWGARGRPGVLAEQNKVRLIWNALIRKVWS